MLNKALENVFTVHGFICTCIQVSMISGGLFLYIMFQVNVMGRDVSMGGGGYPDASIQMPGKSSKNKS